VREERRNAVGKKVRGRAVAASRASVSVLTAMCALERGRDGGGGDTDSLGHDPAFQDSGIAGPVCRDVQAVTHRPDIGPGNQPGYRLFGVVGRLGNRSRSGVPMGKPPISRHSVHSASVEAGADMRSENGMHRGYRAFRTGIVVCETSPGASAPVSRDHAASAMTMAPVQLSPESSAPGSIASRMIPRTA